jgi:secretion/DNA translocation related TadE-like protein
VNDDRGSGSLLAVSIVAAMLALVSLLLPLSIVLSAKQRAAAVADVAALAAADVAVGALPGVPCDSASSAAKANGALLGDCRVDGAIVTVAVGITILGFDVRARATAGPPGSGVD